MQGKFKKAMITIQALFIVMTLVLTGCGKNTEKNGNTQSRQNEQHKDDDANKPYEFTIFRTAWTHLNDEIDPVIQAINQKLNVKIKILTSPYETWAEKYNIMVTSGDIPDLSVTTGPGTANFNDWVNQGIYLDLLDLYYENCPNIQKYLDDRIIQAHKMDGGKLYGIPKPQFTETVYVIRKDWLDNLNLPVPSTLDELYRALKAFKEQDPERNGEHDTYGLCSEDTLNTISFIFSAFGCGVTPNTAENWIFDENGRLTSALLAPGMKDSIVFINKLYREGILDQEWMLTKSQAYTDKLATRKVGIMPAGIQNLSYIEKKMRESIPDSELVPIDEIKGPNGQYMPQMQKGFYMVSSVSKKAENPEKILEFLDFLMSEEGDMMVRYGIEGITYTKTDDGKLIRNDEAVKRYALEAGHSFRQIMQPTTINVLPENDPKAAQLVEIAKKMSNGPFYPVPTLQPGSLKEVTARQGADFVINSVAAIVVSKGDPAAEWDAFIKEWRETGGDVLIREINELYELNQGKS